PGPVDDQAPPLERVDHALAIPPRDRARAAHRRVQAVKPAFGSDGAERGALRLGQGTGAHGQISTSAGSGAAAPFAAAGGRGVDDRRTSVAYAAKLISAFPHGVPGWIEAPALSASATSAISCSATGEPLGGGAALA